MFISYAIFLGLILADVAFCRWAIARLPRQRAGIAFVVVFTALQVTFLLYLTIASTFADVPDVLPLPWSVLAYLWHLFILPVWVLATLPVVTLARMKSAWRLLRLHNTPSAVASQPPPSLTRRRLLAAAGATVAPVVALASLPVAVRELHRFRVRRVELRLPSLPPDLDGLTIAHVSDLHIGRFLPGGMIERVADATNELAPDLIAITGDLNDISMTRTALARDFVNRLRPRHGIALIEGNHDTMTDAERFEQGMLDAGAPLLLDESRAFHIPGRTTPVELMGIAWGTPVRGREFGRRGKDAARLFRASGESATAASIDRVWSGRDPGAFPILLAHHPHAFDHAASVGTPLTLAGHTHGGQIMLNDHCGAGPWRFRYWSGLYQRLGAQLFVSNGIGNWFPLRINAPAEIVHLTLRRDAATNSAGDRPGSPPLG